MNKTIRKISLITIKNRKALCARSKGKNLWYLPGGKPESDETDLQALKREIREELSIEIGTTKAEKLGSFDAIADGQADQVRISMICYTAPTFGEPTPSSEIEEIAWLNSENQQLLSKVSQLVFQSLKEKDLID